MGEHLKRQNPISALNQTPWHLLFIIVEVHAISDEILAQSVDLKTSNPRQHFDKSFLILRKFWL